MYLLCGLDFCHQKYYSIVVLVSLIDREIPNSTTLNNVILMIVILIAQIGDDNIVGVVSPSGKWR